MSERVHACVREGRSERMCVSEGVSESTDAGFCACARACMHEEGSRDGESACGTEEQG